LGGNEKNWEALRRIEELRRRREGKKRALRVAESKTL
jgi:hypothetical protein